MKSPVALAATITVLAFGAVACGGEAAGSKAAKEAGDDGLVPVTFAAISVGQVAPIVLGKEQGIFEDHGIDLTIEYIEAAAVIPTLLGKDADFGWLNAPAVLAARSNNVPVKAVTTSSVAGDDPAAFPIQVLAPAKSDIKSAEDLVGKKVAVDTLYQLPDLGMRAALLDADVDPNDIDLVEIPFPDMGTALKAGRVDAILATEPFVTINKKASGAVPILSASAGQDPETPQSVIVSSEAFISGNANVVADFRAAVDESSEYAVKHEDKVRATLPTFTQLEPDLADAISLAPIDPTDDPEGWKSWADLLVKVGAVDEKPDVEAAFLAD